MIVYPTEFISYGSPQPKRSLCDIKHHGIQHPHTHTQARTVRRVSTPLVHSLSVRKLYPTMHACTFSTGSRSNALGHTRRASTLLSSLSVVGVAIAPAGPNHSQPQSVIECACFSIRRPPGSSPIFIRRCVWCWCCALECSTLLCSFACVRGLKVRCGCVSPVQNIIKYHPHTVCEDCIADIERGSHKVATDLMLG